MASLKTAVGVLLALIVGGCATTPAPSLWRMSDVAGAYTVSVSLTDTKKNVLAKVDPAVARKVIEVQKRIETVSGIRTAEFFVASGDQPNAFSADTARGRIVAVNVAMLAMIGDDIDGYASVLGHEYAHLALQHSSVRREREQTRQAVSNTIGLALAAVGVPLAGTVANVGTTAVERTYTRDEERDADRLGLEYVSKAGYNVFGAVRLWQKMAQNAAQGGIPFLASHPSSSERLKTLTEMAETAASGKATGQ